MAEKKRKSYGVKKVEEKYVCEECHAEVPIMQDCPDCKKEIDWERVFREARPY
jgi:primosomal protein N'